MRIAGPARRPRMRLDTAEALLLAQLLDELAATVTDGDADGEVTRRLYPSAYPDDDEAAAEFRSLTEGELRGQRVQRITACRAQLPDAAGSARAGVDVELGDADDARRWLQVFNDLRLVHGTRLGVSEDDDHLLDPTDPAEVPRLIYVWLTEVQDVLVRAVMR